MQQQSQQSPLCAIFALLVARGPGAETYGQVATGRENARAIRCDCRFLARDQSTEDGGSDRLPQLRAVCPDSGGV